MVAAGAAKGGLWLLNRSEVSRLRPLKGWVCKVHYLRIAAVGMADGESRLSTLLASDALNAALRTNVVEGLGAAIRRVSHEQQLWAVFPGLRVGSIRLSMNGMARRLVLGLLNLAGCAPT